MLRKSLTALTAFAIIAGTLPFTAFAGKVSAPVDIESSVPKNIAGGDVVSALVRVIARAELETLEVSFTPSSGLELLSGGGPHSFAAVKKGETLEFTLEVLLTDPEVGYLNVFTTTVARAKTMGKTVAIRFGVAGPVTQRKLESANVRVMPDGERLILHQAEKR